MTEENKNLTVYCAQIFVAIFASFIIKDGFRDGHTAIPIAIIISLGGFFLVLHILMKNKSWNAKLIFSAAYLVVLLIAARTI